MKKLALLLAVCLITWSLAGCQTQPAPSSGETSASAGSVSSGAQPESSLPEGDPVVVCVNNDFEQDMEELLDYLSAIGVETEYELLVLPSRTEDREAELTRLRTEIMAGGGPDAFVLGAVLPGTRMDEGKSQEPLFPNVEKSMYSHLFLDLEDMAQNSEIVDLESCNQVVMDVGVTSQGRFLLPLTYTFSALLFDRSALNDPDYTFSTLEELLQSDEEALKGVMAWNTLGLFPNCLGPWRTMRARTCWSPRRVCRPPWSRPTPLWPCRMRPTTRGNWRTRASADPSAGTCCRSCSGRRPLTPCSLFPTRRGASSRR